MKLKLILLGIALGGWITSYAQNILNLSTGQYSDSVIKTIPQRDIIEEKDGVTVIYNFHHAYVQSNPQSPESKLIKIEGLGINDIPGEPALLGRSDLFAVPQGKRAELRIIKADFKNYDFNLSPAIPALPDNEIAGKNELPEITPFQGFKPIEIISLPQTETYRSVNLQKVIISPIQYDYQNQKLRAYTEIQYKLTFVDAPDQKPNIELELSPTDHLISNLVLNPSQVGRPFNQSYSPKRYLILTTPEFRSTVTNFENWKRMFGFKTTVVSNTGWTPQLVQSTINNYASTYQDLYYILIVGDQEDVPGQIINGHLTDYRYGCVEGNYKAIPDFYVGRISVDNTTELTNVINKIIRYESNPCTDASFYNNGLNCAYFEDMDTIIHYADRRFAQTSEDIRNHLISQGKSIQRVYYTEGFIRPLYWNNDYYSYGEPLPEELKKPNFLWNGNATDIKSNIDNGTFYVLHRGHGQPGYWKFPHYTASEVENLNNGINKLPLVFSINCLTGKFNEPSPCFAETFLRKSNGGCIGIYAATASSYSGYNDILTCGMFDAIWPDPPLRPIFPDISYPSNLNTSSLLGLREILNAGLARMDEAYFPTRSNHKVLTHEIFHLFGDPGMQFRNDLSTPFTGVTITRDEGAGNITVIVPGGAERISFNPDGSNNISLFSGTQASYSCSSPESTTICISSRNKIPYIDYGLTVGPPLQLQTSNSITNISGSGNAKIVNFTLSPNISTARIKLVSLEGRTLLSLPYQQDSTQVSLSLNTLKAGIYFCILEVDGVACDSKRIIIY